MTWILSKIVANPAVLLFLLLGAFLFGLSSGGSFAWWVQGVKLESARNDLLVLQTSVKTLGEQAKIDKEKIELAQSKNLMKVKEYEESLPAVRSDAVAAYRLRYPSTRGCGVPKPSSSKQVDERATEEPLAD